MFNMNHDFPRQSYPRSAASTTTLIVDHTGKKISVVLSMEEFAAIMEELEELQDIKLYDEAKQSNDPSIPIDEAFNMIEAKRKIYS
jgi:hypothetical protein